MSGLVYSFMRLAVPAAVGAVAVVLAHVIGSSELPWQWLLVPVAVMGFAVGTAADRADAVARGETADRFIAMLMRGGNSRIAITHTHRLERELREALRKRDARGRYAGDEPDFPTEWPPAAEDAAQLRMPGV